MNSQDDEQASEPEQVSLALTDNVMKAVDYAFTEAQDYLTSGVGLAPFTVTVVDEGLEVNDQSAETSDDVYDAVRMLLAEDMPEGYALCYDGYVEGDDGRQDAIVVEAANRGDISACALAMTYTLDDDGYTFDANYGFAGTMPQLYPAGTKPIESGMAALEREEREQATPADGAPSEEGASSGETDAAPEPEAEA